MSENSRIDHFEAVAIKKSKVEGWRVYHWKRAGDDLIMTGSVPAVISRGKNKGQFKWTGPGTSVVVTRSERDQECARYIKETGNCGDCYGDGQMVSGWSAAEGARYRKCSTCEGTGKAFLKSEKP